MFQGVLHANARKIIASYVPAMPPKAHILCSGNFSIETTLRMNGYQGRITGCDVSTYSCMLGAYLAGGDLPLVMDFGEFDEFEPLSAHLDDQQGRAAAVAVALDAMQFAKRKNDYQNRMMDAYAKRWDELVEKTRVRLQKKKEAVALDEFHAIDSAERILAIEPGSDNIVLTFPPTYAGGYERLYGDLDKLCVWARPDYLPIGQVDEYARQIVARPGPWMFMAEKPTPELEDVVGTPIARSPRGSAVNIFTYSNLINAPARLLRRELQLAEPPYRRLTDADVIQPDSRLTIHRITGPEANYIRQVYVSVEVAQSSAQYSYAVAVDGKLIGLLLFQEPNFDIKIDGESHGDTMYMMADLAIATARYPRLSKLVLMAAISQEMKADLEHRTIREVQYNITSAFSRHQESMKYRGVFKRLSRKEQGDIFVLTYYGKMGSWTLDEAMRKWAKSHLKEQPQTAASTT